jgi:hypothetical protein
VLSVGGSAAEKNLVRRQNEAATRIANSVCSEDDRENLLSGDDGGQETNFVLRS